MAISNNDSNTRTEAPRPAAAEVFPGATLNNAGAPGGSNDLLSLLGRIGASRIDAAVQPYLDRVMQGVHQHVKSAELRPLARCENAFVVSYKGADGRLNFVAIQVVNSADPVHSDYVPLSFKFAMIQEEIKSVWHSENGRIVDMRIIQSNYLPEMDRADIMAETIVRSFLTLGDPDSSRTTYRTIVGTEFSVSYALSEGKALESALSPHGVRPRLEYTMTLNAKIKNDGGMRELRDLNNSWRPIGVIGGYMEIRGRENVFNPMLNRHELRWKPVFNITTMNSYLPLEGVGALLLAAFCPTVYHQKFWADQWLTTLADNRPQPGLLEEDKQNPGQPVIIRGREEMDEFIETYFDRPHIAIQLQDGHDMIPGMQLIANASDEARAHLISRWANFFEMDPNTVQFPMLGAQVEQRFEGVVGEPSGQLTDSRNFDYLYFAATNGLGSLDENSKRTLMGISNPTERAKLVASLTSNFRPLYNTTVFMINPELITFLANATKARGLMIVDPSSRQESRPLGSILEGFGSISNVTTAVSSGIRDRGWGLGSVWN